MDAAVGGPSAHVLLRDRTRHAHEAAEASRGMRRLMAGELDHTGYLTLLRAQRALLRAWEASRADWLASAVPAAGWRFISRAALLDADLSAVVESTVPHAWPDTPPPLLHDEAHGSERPSAKAGATEDAGQDPATCWGELYVIEGSALGGRLIVRRLRELYPEHSHHFYSLGEDAPARWRRFQSILDTTLTDEASRQAAVNGAAGMFAQFRQTLDDPSRHV